MELQLLPNPSKTCASRMIKKLLGTACVFAFVALFTGCNAVQDYSIRSYQGPVPLADYRYVNPESYGVPVEPR